jgi:hypothetical protein
MGAHERGALPCLKELPHDCTTRVPLYFIGQRYRILYPVPTIAIGTRTTYLPLASRALILPEMPLLFLNPRLSNLTNDSYLDLSTPDGNQRWRIYPTTIYRGVSSVSPDSRTILFTHFDNPPYGLFAINPNGTHVRPVAMQSPANWSPDSTATALQISQTFGDDLIYTTLNGTPRTVATNTVSSSFAWTPNGQGLVYAAKRNGQQDIFRFEQDGTKETLLYQSPVDDWLIDVIPDGRLLVMSRQETHFVVTRLEADGSNPLRLFEDSGGPTYATFDPDPTSRFLFLRNLPATQSAIGFGVYTTSGEPVWTLTDFCLPFEPDERCSVQTVAWHPSGEEVVFTVEQLSYIDPKGNRIYHSRLLAMRTDGSETTPRLLDQGEFFGPQEPRFSPDGRYVAYEWGLRASYAEEVRVIDMQTGNESVVSWPWGLDLIAWLDATP